MSVSRDAPAEPLPNVRVFTAELARRKSKAWIGTMLIFGVALGVSLTVGPEWLQWAMLPWSVSLVRASYWTGRMRGIRDGI